MNRVVVDAQGRRAASPSSDYTTIVWNLEDRSAELVLRGHADDVEDFVFVDDDLGASVSRDWRVLVWNLHRARSSDVLEGHEKDVLSITHHDGKLFTSGDDMTLRVWDVVTGGQTPGLGPVRVRDRHVRDRPAARTGRARLRRRRHPHLRHRQRRSGRRDPRPRVRHQEGGRLAR